MMLLGQFIAHTGNSLFGNNQCVGSSIVGIQLNERVAGLLVEKELEFFAPILEGPDRIDLAILGGAKVTDKIQLIRHLLKRVRHLIIGGAMPFTFLTVLYGMKVMLLQYEKIFICRLAIACMMKRVLPL